MSDLNTIMEFDHVIRVHADGTITDEPGIHEPTLYDDVIQSDNWEFFTTGYSGQGATHEWMAKNPIMHDSEFIGGGLERDIRETPGVYVALVSYYSEGPDDEPDTDELYAEGWAIAKLKEGQ